MFDSSYFRGKSDFSFIKKIGNTDHISAWKCKGLSNESIKPLATSGNSLPPILNHNGSRARIKFDGQCLKQDLIIKL